MKKKEDIVNDPLQAKVKELYLQLNSFSSFSSSEKRELESLRNQKDRLERALSNTTVIWLLLFSHQSILIQDGFNLKSQHFNLKSKKSKLNNFVDPLDKDENAAIEEVKWKNKNKLSIWKFKEMVHFVQPTVVRSGRPTTTMKTSFQRRTNIMPHISREEIVMDRNIMIVNDALSSSDDSHRKMLLLHRNRLTSSSSSSSSSDDSDHKITYQNAPVRNARDIRSSSGGNFKIYNGPTPAARSTSNSRTGFDSLI
jgi:hypothetical protein